MFTVFYFLNQDPVKFYALHYHFFWGSLNLDLPLWWGPLRESRIAVLLNVPIYHGLILPGLTGPHVYLELPGVECWPLVKVTDCTLFPPSPPPFLVYFSVPPSIRHSVSYSWASRVRGGSPVLLHGVPILCCALCCQLGLSLHHPSTSLHTVGPGLGWAEAKANELLLY